MRGPDDPYPDVLTRITQAHIQQDVATASAEMDKIKFVEPGRVTQRWPAMSVIAEVYTRDRYHCRYCGERVILTAVMRLVSRLHPDVFPYHTNWKADSTHAAFIARSATLDHVRPVARGGDPVALDNLVTACWGCNRRKGDLALEEVGWSLVKSPQTNWKGLTDMFRPLWEASGCPSLSEDEAAWMRATSRATTQHN